LGVAVVVLALGLSGSVHGDNWSPVVVTGDRVCLRARPEARSEVVHQVSTGDALQVDLTSTGQWVEVIAPPSAEVWISSDLVSNDVVAVSKGLVRAGPSRNYSTVGTVGRGDRLVVRRRQNGWLQIAPPSSCRLWISRDYVRQAPPRLTADSSAGSEVLSVASSKPSSLRPVIMAVEFPPEAVAAGTNSTPTLPTVERTEDRSPTPVSSLTHGPAMAVGQRPGTASVVASSRALAPLPDELRGLDLEPGVGQDREAVYRGMLERCNWFWRAAPYRVVVEHPRRGTVVLCHVTGVPKDVDGLVGKAVEVRGREFRVRRQERPLVVAATVRERAEER